jgi:tyrosinase
VAVFSRQDDTQCAACARRRDSGGVIRGILVVPDEIVCDVILEFIANPPNPEKKISMAGVMQLLKERLTGAIVGKDGSTIIIPNLDEAKKQGGFPRWTVPDVTLLTSIAAIKQVEGSNKDGPVEFTNWVNHGEVFGDKTKGN